MNENTLNKLEYEVIRNQVTDHAKSNLGRARAQAMEIRTDRRAIERMLDETVEATQVLDALLQAPLYGLHDIGALLEKVKMGSALQPGELLTVSDVLRGMRLTRQQLDRFEHQSPMLWRIAATMGQFKEIEEEIQAALQGDHVRSSASKALGTIRRKLEIVAGRITSRLERILSSEAYKSHIQEPVIQHRDGIPVIPVKAVSRNRIAGRVIDRSASGQTIFLCPDAVAKMVDEQRALQLEEEAEVYQILMILTGMVHEQIEEIGQSLDRLAELDFIFARAGYSRTYGGVRPEYVPQDLVDLRGAFHPLLPDAVSNDLRVGEACRGLLITGPNTGGKTMALKTVGLNVLMAQSGILPACGPGSRLSVFRQVFVDMGDGQDLSQSLSTFSAHIANLTGIVAASGRGTLCLIDEIGTGTDPREGAALGIAILTRMYESGSLLMGTSHYGELKDFAERHGGFMNASMAFDPDTLAPAFHIVYDSYGESNGVLIARRLGLDPGAIALAERILATEDPGALYAALPQKTFRTREARRSGMTQCPYDQGDQVLDRESGRRGIFHSVEPTRPYAKVLFGEAFERVHLKRLKRTFTRDELYPEGYDLEQLFVSFAERKMARDIEKKRLYKQKDIQKKLKST